MARIKKLNERQLTNLVKQIIREEEEQADSGVFSAKDKEVSWGKLRQYLKDMYTDYKNWFSDVQPSEFNEVMTIFKAVIDLAKVKNINNKGADVISQYLKQHVKPLERQYDMSQQDETPEAPPEPKYGEVNESKRSNYSRLYKRLMKEDKMGPYNPFDIDKELETGGRTAGQGAPETEEEALSIISKKMGGVPIPPNTDPQMLINFCCFFNLSWCCEDKWPFPLDPRKRY